MKKSKITETNKKNPGQPGRRNSISQVDEIVSITRETGARENIQSSGGVILGYRLNERQPAALARC